MRKFLLQNEYGEQQALQGGDIFLYAPDGMGYEDEVEYLQTNGFYLPINAAQAQVEKNGTLVFYGNGYKRYQELMNWVLAAQKLTLAYKPLNDWYYQNIAITRVEKSELRLNGQVLEVPVTFTPLSPIYTPYEQEIKISGETEDRYKRYTYAYQISRDSFGNRISDTTEPEYIGKSLTAITEDAIATPIDVIRIINGEEVEVHGFMLGYGNFVWYNGGYYFVDMNMHWQVLTPIYCYTYSNTAVAGQIKFTIAAQIDCDFSLTLYGAISAPSITVTRNDTRKTIGIIDLTAVSAQAGEKIEFNTVAGRAGAVLVDSAGHSTDLTSFLGLATGYPTYFRIPANVSCSLQVTAASLEGLKANIKIYRYFRTV